MRLSNVFVKTIWLDKQEELRKVRILDSFKSMLILQHNLEMVTFTD